MQTALACLLLSSMSGSALRPSCTPLKVVDSSGPCKFTTVSQPYLPGPLQEKGDALHAMEIGLSLEKLNFQKLRDLHEVADKSNDAQMADFVEDMLAEQVTSAVKCIGLQRCLSSRRRTCWQSTGLLPGTSRSIQESELHTVEGMLTELGLCLGKTLLWSLVVSKPCCTACLPNPCLFLHQAML